jgi:hypothetical protein
VDCHDAASLLDRARHFLPVELLDIAFATRPDIRLKLWIVVVGIAQA